MLYHTAAWVTGCLLDLLIGDPVSLPHPIRLIGKLIYALDRLLMGEAKEGRNPRREVLKGLLLTVTVLVTTAFSVSFILILCYRLNVYVGMAAEAVLTCYIMAARSLAYESKKVERELLKGDVEGARHAVSMIVGRDTAVLDERGIARAAVETVAENTSDGVIAPLIYTFIGGPILGFIYKAVNTMDSMVGYHNDRYESFGKCAARLDDFVNFIPARISALFMIASAGLLGKNYSMKGAAKIFFRDRYNHKSPNSAQTESVCAGALGLRLAGDAWYFGRLVKKPFIGDEVREIEPGDISKTCRLMYMTELLVAIFLLLAGGAVALLSGLGLHAF